MKTKTKLKKILSIAFTACIMVAIVISSCKKGDTGPAGTDGKDGTNGTNGANGVAVSAADKAAFNAADGMNGGRLYDHWINELVDESAANIVTDTAITKHKGMFRCKSCHGWDLKGRNGAFAIMPINSSNPQCAYNNLYQWSHMHNIREVFDAVKNVAGTYVNYLRATASKGTDPSIMSMPTMPDYSKYLTDAQIWNFVKFLKVEAMNTDNFYDMAIIKPYPQAAKDESAVVYTNVGKNGNAANGTLFISTNCSCHGADGTNINIYCQGDYLGNTFRDDPYEVQHKVKFGMPKDYDHLSTSCTGQNNNPMPAISGITESIIRDILVAGQDTTAYPSY